MLLFLSARMVKASSRGLSSTSRITLSFIPCLLELGKCEIEGRALIHLPFGPDAPAVARDDAQDGRQANPCALKFFSRMMTLKRAEKLIDIGHIETRALVAYIIENLPVRSLLLTESDLGLLPPGREFPCVAEQVHEHDF